MHKYESRISFFAEDIISLNGKMKYEFALKSIINISKYGNMERKIFRSRRESPTNFSADIDESQVAIEPKWALFELLISSDVSHAVLSSFIRGRL